MPRGLLHIAACVNLSGARVFGYRPMLTPGKVRELTHADWVCDDAPLRVATGCNYLGLTFDPDCIEAACHAVRTQGTGTTGSRAANGSYAVHVQLERDLADFFGRRGVIVFSTGYVANLGMLSTLAGPGCSRGHRSGVGP